MGILGYLKVYLLLYNCVLVDNLVGQLEAVYVQYVDVTALCTDHQLIPADSQTTSSDRLQFTVNI